MQSEHSGGRGWDEAMAGRTAELPGVLSPGTGLGFCWPMGPTVETVGYCRSSLTGLPSPRRPGTQATRTFRRATADDHSGVRRQSAAATALSAAGRTSVVLPADVAQSGVALRLPTVAGRSLLVRPESQGSGGPSPHRHHRQVAGQNLVGRGSRRALESMPPEGLYPHSIQDLFKIV
jgi:hypothetical protein